MGFPIIAALILGSTAVQVYGQLEAGKDQESDRKSTRLNSSHGYISYAVFCLKKKNNKQKTKKKNKKNILNYFFNQRQKDALSADAV